MENEIVQEAVREYLTEERKETFKKILEDEAFLKREAKKGDAERYRHALDLWTANPEGPPFIYEFLKGNLKRLSEEDKGQDAGGSGRIITP
jgi:hypothetical protein